MKRLIAIAGLAALVACNQTEAEPEAQPTVEEAAAMTTGNGSAPGTYEAVAADGTVTLATLNADGSYSDVIDGEVVEFGTWAVVDGKTCFTPAADSEGTATCYTESDVAADGSFTATPDEGDPLTVRPAAGG